MDLDTGSRLIRAARSMLRWDSARFAKALKVGVATIKRVEAGHVVSDEVLRVILARLPSIGIIILEPDAGRGIIGGVILTGKARLAGAAKPSERQEQKPA